MKHTNDKCVIVGPVRLSYLNVFAPRKNEIKTGQPMEYSVQLLFPKAANQFQTNAAEEVAAVIDAIKTAFKEKHPAVQKWEAPLKDGDKETNSEGMPKAPGYWYMTVWCGTDYPPVLIDCDRNTVTGGWVSGDWGKVKVSLFAYCHQGKYGLSAGLRAVQFLFKDEPLGSANDPETVKGEFDDEKGDKATVGGGPEDEADPFAD